MTMDFGIRRCAPSTEMEIELHVCHDQRHPATVTATKRRSQGLPLYQRIWRYGQ